MLNFKVDKTKDCIIINTDEWIQNSENSLKRYKMSGRSIITYLTEVVDKNIVSDKFKEVDSVLEKGEIVLISKIASEISRDRAITIDNKKYYNIPIMQVLGYFEDNKVSFDTLNLLYNKVLVEKVSLNEGIFYTEDHSMVGRVLKTGTHGFDSEWNIKPLQVKVNDVVLIKDNVSTKVTLDNKEYYVLEEGAIVGIFGDDLKLDSLRVINNSVLLKEYIDEKLLGSDLLYTPFLNYKDLDETDIYNRNMFQVVKVDKSLENLEIGDIVLADRSVSNYVSVNEDKYEDKYFMFTGMFYIDAKIR